MTNQRQLAGLAGIPALHSGLWSWPQTNIRPLPWYCRKLWLWPWLLSVRCRRCSCAGTTSRRALRPYAHSPTYKYSLLQLSAVSRCLECPSRCALPAARIHMQCRTAEPSLCVILCAPGWMLAMYGGDCRVVHGDTPSAVHLSCSGLLSLAFEKRRDGSLARILEHGGCGALVPIRLRRALDLLLPPQQRPTVLPSHLDFVGSSGGVLREHTGPLVPKHSYVELLVFVVPVRDGPSWVSIVL